MGLVAGAQDIDIVSDQKLAGARGCGPPLGDEFGRTEIGFPARIGKPFGQSFVFSRRISDSLQR